jgi:hypothetical protein
MEHGAPPLPGLEEMVAALGGEMELHSEPALGRTFSVVPAAGSQAGRATA